MKELLERLMTDAKAKASKIELELELTMEQSKQLDKDLKEFGEIAPASIAVCLLTQLERERNVQETASCLNFGVVMSDAEIKAFGEWQTNNKKLLKAAIIHCIDQI
jgi:hypothetical protein